MNALPAISKSNDVVKVSFGDILAWRGVQKVQGMFRVLLLV